MTQAEVETRNSIENLLDRPPHDVKKRMERTLSAFADRVCTDAANELIDEYDLTKLYGIELVTT